MKYRCKEEGKVAKETAFDIWRGSYRCTIRMNELSDSDWEAIAAAVIEAYESRAWHRP